MKKFFLLLLSIVLSLPIFAEECQKGYIDCTGNCGRYVDANADGYCDISPLSPELRAELFPPAVEESSTSYWLIQIVLGVLFLYLVSYLLVRFNVWTKQTHRKCWNVLLAITFLVSCLIGLLLVVFINYNIQVDGYRTWLTLHVDFGIAMTIICIIHLIWHWNYYMNLLGKKK